MKAVEAVEQIIDYDYRRQNHLMVVSNVPAGVCGQCGEKYFKPDVLKRMDVVYHEIFERNEKPHRTLSIPAVSLAKIRWLFEGLPNNLKYA